MNCSVLVVVVVVVRTVFSTPIRTTVLLQAMSRWSSPSEAGLLTSTRVGGVTEVI